MKQLNKSITRERSSFVMEDPNKQFIKRKICEAIGNTHISFEKTSEGFDLKVKFKRKEN